ncbi:MAG: acetyl-CoA carboxylase subunit beta [Ignavibacteria bacterium GWB2_35_12]|nr:MAG: acetyl-CoA carboxylase subunit beta [Ignavibacteria bacterium GWA2_35_8]OGU38878.1 MAG: acetyl-CoA carboxylase subunit beta [Ignavibacteria bacterium GWB2_35_12]OGU94393.1 MAG: acetyl-CoA carboxylase subunit beta [Ignavibacteria bacterium RIFOXYA2_FULL_35_10]OGV20332.1 MAG: acetyl-CoA carboxylase subunit beta [Ignavibacteria bacterium RIFOXYC2_FULL_35_21]
MAWFQRTKENIQEKGQLEMPDGLWAKCPECSEVIFKKQLEDNYFMCTKCSYHFRIGSEEFIQIILDDGSFVETETNVKSVDSLKFTDSKSYEIRLKENYSKTELNDALTVGFGTINGKAVSFGCMNFNFIGGSMGAVVGEKFYRAAKYSLDKKVPLIVVSATGGARMQEAAFSLMQMAKTSAVLSLLEEAKIPYISILTDPTTGGVSASYGMLGDIIIAEPNALIGFAGPRVIEQTIKRKLPQGFQRAEFVLEHGFVDMVVKRNELKSTLFNLIEWFGF